MVAWEYEVHLGSKLCMAMEVFFCDVLRMLPSEFDEDPKEPSLDKEERSCMIVMFVIIMSAENDWSKCSSQDRLSLIHI